MSIAKNPVEVLVGDGRVYVNSQYVGAISGGVKKSRKKTYSEIKSGTDLILVAKTGDSTKFSFNLMETNLDLLRTLMPDLLEEIEGAGTATVTGDFVAGISASRKGALSNRKLTDAAVSVSLAARLATGATVGATKIYLESVRGFSAGDSVTLRNGPTTETVTVKTGGVNVGERSLTLSAGVANSYPTGALAVDTTVALAEGTDYYLDRLDGTVWLKAGSTKLSEGDGLSVGYTHATYHGRGFAWGGGSDVDSPVRIDFWHKRRDGKYINLAFFRCQADGDFDLDFPEDKEVTVPISVTALVDPTRGAGRQVGKMMVYEAAAAPDGGW